MFGDLLCESQWTEQCFWQPLTAFQCKCVQNAESAATFHNKPMIITSVDTGFKHQASREVTPAQVYRSCRDMERIMTVAIRYGANASPAHRAAASLKNLSITASIFWVLKGFHKKCTAPNCLAASVSWG